VNATHLDPPIRPTRQSRAHKTRERILDVTEELLEERSFESISVSEIVRRAGTSVGAFYGRFRDKDALLPALYERNDTWVTARAQALDEEAPWSGMALAEMTTWLASEVIGLFRHRRFLMRAVTLHARLRPEKIDAETRARRVREMSFLRVALLSRSDEITHPDPERAVDFAILMAAAACREFILFGDAPHAASTPLSDEQLAREVARQMLSYLTSAAGPGGHAPQIVNGDKQ
jgi:AcrR family transcriptional regulator